jgi:hypothetical protein
VRGLIPATVALAVLSSRPGPAQSPPPAPTRTHVVLLGTHEVLTLDWLSRRPDFKNYAAQFHTTTPQLVELATKARPRLLVLSHTSLSIRPSVDSERSTMATMLREMAGYQGQVVVGRDLDVY